MKNRILTITIIFIVLVIGMINHVNADMGQKPSITIKLKNMSTTDYLIDLLVYDESGNNYSDEANYNGDGLTKEQIELLHNINYDGWISEGTRWNSYLLFADCAGNKNFEHYFSYFGTPETYKVIIVNNKTGEIKLSDEIHRTELTSTVTLDVNSMKVANKEVNKFSTIKNMAIALVITIIVELFIAAIMKIKDLKVIALVNFITNIIMQTILLVTPFAYLLTFCTLEILVIVSEYLLYKNYLKDVSNNKIILYTIIANIITAALTFLIPSV